MRSIVLSLAMGAVAACAAAHNTTPAPSAIDSDEYAIYRRVLEDSQSAEPVFVLATAGAEDDADTVAGATEDPELRAAFAAVARLRAVISPTELRVPRARVIADPGLPAWRTPLLEQEQQWEQIRTRYGAHAAFVHLSRVGFSRDRMRAIVMYSVRAGTRCNFAVYAAVYQRDHTGWQPIANSAEFC
jgi:hypothetical protein